MENIVKSEAELKEVLFENQFGLNILELTIDQHSFDELCGLLNELANIWKTLEVVDKEIVAFVAEILMITHNKLVYGGFDQEDNAKLLKMHSDIEVLFLEKCLISAK